MKQIYLVFAKHKTDGREWHSFYFDKVYKTRKDALTALKGHEKVSSSVTRIIKKFVAA